MATHSSDLLVVDGNERRSSLHRSRSGGYVDHLEEKTKWDRRDREREMKRYHDSRYGTSSPSTSAQRPPTSDRLAVPVFGTTTRRNLSSSDIGELQRTSERSYNVQEVRPSSKPAHGYDLSNDSVLPSQLPVRFERKPQHQKRPSIQVQIHQDHPPSSSPATATSPTPKRSPSASPRSPTAQLQLMYQYVLLQKKLNQIEKTCLPYLKVEAANPQDLTFEKIAEQTKGFAFDLQVWAHVANVEGLARIDARKRGVVEAAARNLERLIGRVAELGEICLRAKPKDLKVEETPVVDDEGLFDDEEDSIEEDTGDTTETLGFIIHTSLHSIELQIQNLKLLSRSLQEATPNAKDEVIAVARLVEESVKYFGSQEALDRYSIDGRFSGRKGLEEARAR
ncbi:hypothetical protein EJ02DRAFT_335884 [Clathrospora elynae]|uniref:Uncharacterized protein n=1 Tax=Clathrospora elynae TaxID=706981 RepID=A0A6A5T0W2_9PLEO|nr:hypothetical protein EJ02DRAFT_335884 [Clathrospora elynae]